MRKTVVSLIALGFSLQSFGCTLEHSDANYYLRERPQRPNGIQTAAFTGKASSVSDHKNGNTHITEVAFSVTKAWQGKMQAADKVKIRFSTSNDSPCYEGSFNPKAGEQWIIFGTYGENDVIYVDAFLSTQLKNGKLPRKLQVDISKHQSTANKSSQPTR